ncbi:hypothetical protein HHI36_003392 [Cryptolaemus montrouzieri]|uniref:Uncharacterized protein n=1 Tax=Cryptolaemus montrouzieri TaxID=559131 RepID=A0ABD2PD98_9CUCU
MARYNLNPIHSCHRQPEIARLEVKVQNQDPNRYNPPQSLHHWRILHPTQYFLVVILMKKWKRKNLLRVATWNIKSLNNRDHEILKELNDNKIDICALQETKKKGKGQIQHAQHTVIYSGVQKHDRAKEGVALVIHTR